MTEGAGGRIRDADRTRAELLAVATEIFAAEGYSGARVDEIAERTRTTKRRNERSTSAISSRSRPSAGSPS